MAECAPLVCKSWKVSAYCPAHETLPTKFVFKVVKICWVNKLFLKVWNQGPMSSIVYNYNLSSLLFFLQAYLRREYITLNVKLNDIHTYITKLQQQEGHNAPEQINRSKQLLWSVTDLSKQIIRQLDSIIIVKYTESWSQLFGDIYWLLAISVESNDTAVTSSQKSSS